MRMKLIAVIPVMLDGEQAGRPRTAKVEAVALLFDNMRWTLDFADYHAMKEEIGNVIEVTDYEEMPTQLH
jgi:hypothetical protein